MKVIIVHSAYGSPGENWIPWLKEELEKLGCQTIVPRFPTPKGQELSRWLTILNRALSKSDRETVFVGHSIGAALILKKLERLETPIKAAFLIASVTGPIGLREFDSINVSFFEKGFDWKKIKKKCQRFFVYNSDNDPYIPLAHGEKLAQELGVRLAVISGGGHFNQTAGYLQFPRLLKDIKKLL